MGRGRVAVWRILFPNKFDLDGFSTLFDEELESWFTADFTCCDNCYNAYAKTWPGLAVSKRFQENNISLGCFYSGSCFEEIYTEREFRDLCRKMGCPVCGQPLEGNIWAYHPGFNAPKDFEAQMEELGLLAVKTPFLALRHPLGRKVLKEIRKIAAQVPRQKLDCEYFRARPFSTPREPAQFLAPPAAKCGEGRYNHAGRPVLYLASDRSIAFGEVGAPKDGVLIVAIRLKHPQKVLDLAGDVLPSEILQAVTVSALLSAPTEKEGWEKPEYTFSRFVADCAISCGFTAIRYPSVEEPEGFNLVVFPGDQAWQDILELGQIAEFLP